MLAFRTWHRFASLALLAGALTFAVVCNKKDEPTKADGTPPAPPPRPPGPPGPGDNENAMRTTATALGEPDPAPPPPKPPDSLATVKPDFVFTAEEWIAQYERNQPPYKKYEGKVIELKGVVDYVARGELYLKSKPGEFPVYCPTDTEPWKKAFPGQTVVVRGRIDTSLRWEILDAKGPMPDKFTAEELARAVATDPKGMTKRHEGKYIIVTGVIEKAELDKFGNARITFKSTDGAAPVTVVFVAASDFQRTQNKSFQPGVRLTVLGRYGGTSLEGRCEVMELTP